MERRDIVERRQHYHHADLSSKLAILAKVFLKCKRKQHYHPAVAQLNRVSHFATMMLKCDLFLKSHHIHPDLGNIFLQPSMVAWYIHQQASH